MVSSAVIDAIRARSGLIADHAVVTESGDTAISLGVPIVYGIATAKKNGSSATQGTDYNWVEGRPNVTFPSAASDNDFWHFRIKTKLSDSAIEDYGEEAERHVTSKLEGFYADDDILTYPICLNLVINRSAGRIKEDLSSGIALESAQYRSGNDLKREVDRIILAIMNGEAEIVDSGNDKVARVTGSVVGGFKHDDPIETREDLRERLATYNSIYLLYHPFGDNVTDSA